MLRERHEEFGDGLYHEGIARSDATKKDRA